MQVETPAPGLGAELDADDEQTRLFLGQLYRILHDTSGAEGVLLDANGQPLSPRAGLLLFQVYLESGRVEDAAVVAEGLVENHPEELGGHMALATAYARLGRAADSERVLVEAREYHPRRFVLYSRLARLRRSAGDRGGHPVDH